MASIPSPPLYRHPNGAFSSDPKSPSPVDGAKAERDARKIEKLEDKIMDLERELNAMKLQSS